MRNCAPIRRWPPKKMKDGMSRNEAFRAVRLERGNVEVTREIVRSGSWEFFVETCWRLHRLRRAHTRLRNRDDHSDVQYRRYGYSSAFIVCRVRPASDDRRVDSGLRSDPGERPAFSGMATGGNLVPTDSAHWRRECQRDGLQRPNRGKGKKGLELMLMAVGSVLFIGCLNIMNLLLARLSSPRRELAVRSAIGASRWRLTRQMIFESLTLSTIGGVCGLFVAHLGVRLFLAFAPFDVPRLDEVHVDMRVVMFALLVSAVAGLVI